ncbi:uncharacterized protein LOC134788254 isoform X2 [Penaeus indicus]|uniref:uncharacterized protein LOC134788254 isoform X2 n=1 Tax=Penaeus indicus TaxID=29960 RepID=UPI00300C1507
MGKALVAAMTVTLLAAVSSGGRSGGDQMLGLAALEDAVRIRVSADHLEEVADYLRLMGVSWEVYIEDVSQYLQNVTNRRSRRDSLPYPSPRFPCSLDYCPEPLVHRWMSYEEITSFVLSVNSTHYERARTTSVGQTAEGRDIWMVTVHKGTCDDSRGFYIVAGRLSGGGECCK